MFIKRNRTLTSIRKLGKLLRYQTRQRGLTINRLLKHFWRKIFKNQLYSLNFILLTQTNVHTYAGFEPATPGIKGKIACAYITYIMFIYGFSAPREIL